MHKNDIIAGATYTDGKGRLRRVLLVEAHLKAGSNLGMVLYQQADKPPSAKPKTCSLQAFAAWAKWRVGIPRQRQLPRLSSESETVITLQE